MGQPSSIAVLDKAVAVLSAAAAGPAGLADLVQRTRLPRATAHRIAVALERHGLLSRVDGLWVPGPALAALAGSDPLLARAPAVLERLRAVTGESAQLYRRAGAERVCVAAADRASGLRDTVPVGARLSLAAGSAAQVLAAWSDAPPPPDAVFSARTLALVRRRGWAASVGEREPGVCSVSAPVYDEAGHVVAAVSVSGPSDRLGRTPGERLSPAVLAAAAELAP